MESLRSKDDIIWWYDVKSPRTSPCAPRKDDRSKADWFISHGGPHPGTLAAPVSTQQKSKIQPGMMASPLSHKVRHETAQQ